MVLAGQVMILICGSCCDGQEQNQQPDIGKCVHYLRVNESLQKLHFLIILNVSFFSLIHRLKRLVQALSAALLLLAAGCDAAQLPLADGELPLQLVYPEGAIPPPGEPLSLPLAWILMQLLVAAQSCSC